MMSIESMVRSSCVRMYNRADEWIPESVHYLDGHLACQVKFLFTNIDKELDRTTPGSVSSLPEGNGVKPCIEVSDSVMTASDIWTNREQWMDEAAAAKKLWDDLEETKQQEVIRNTMDRILWLHNNTAEWVDPDFDDKTGSCLDLSFTVD